MRRIVLLGFVLLLPGCESWNGFQDYFTSPFVGVGGFINDTVTFRRNVNAPLGDGDNMNRVRGREVTAEPLLPEPGNVWPGPPRPQATLSDLEREQGTPGAPGAPGASPPQVPAGTPGAPHPQPRGSSTPPYQAPVSNLPPPSRGAAPLPTPSIAIPPPLTGIVQTPQGPAVITNGGNGVQTYTLPNGGTGRAINNANGTVTLIGPDGSVQSVPAPR